MLICLRQLIFSQCLENYCSCYIIVHNLIKRRKLQNLAFYSAHSSTTITRILDILSVKQFHFSSRLFLSHLRRLILSIRDMIPTIHMGTSTQSGTPKQFMQKKSRFIDISYFKMGCSSIEKTNLASLQNPFSLLQHQV